MLTIRRGNTKRFSITVQDETGLIPLAGAKVWLTAKRLPSDADVAAIFQLTTDVSGGIVVLDVPSSLIAATVSPANTTAIDNVLTRLFLDWKVRTASGDLKTFASNTLLVLPAITQAT